MTSEEYVIAQKEWAERTKVHKGSKVRTTCIAMSDEDGWDNLWESGMDEDVGCVGVVVCTHSADEDGVYGVRVRMEDGRVWYFPYFVLEPA